MIDIRLLGPEDLATLAAIGDGLFDHPLIPAEAEAFLADPANILLIAVDHGQATGLLTGTLLRHPDKPPSLFIAELGTRDGWRRRGIATALVTRALALARDRGARGVWLGAAADNDGAIALYRSLGAAELPGLFFGWDGALDDEPGG